MKYRLITALLAAAGGAFACSGSPTPEPADESAGTSPQDTEETQVAANTLDPFYSFEAEGHTFELSEPTPGSLLISEKAAIGEALYLDQLQDARSPSELYAHFHDGDIPAEITDFEERASEIGNLLETEQIPVEAISSDPQEGSPERASAGPGLSLLHEDGTGSHFRAENCPTMPENLGFFQIMEGRNPISNKEYCWAAGFINNWTEGPWNSKVLTTRLAAVKGPVEYTLSNGISEFQFQAFQGEQIGHTWFNEVFTHDCCPPWPFACGVCDQEIRIRPMKVSVHGTSGDVWRLGGGFWR